MNAMYNLLFRYFIKNMNSLVKNDALNLVDHRSTITSLNPCKNGKISSMKFCVALCKGLTHFTTNICSENNCSFPYHLTQFLSVFLQRMVFNFDTNDLK